MWKLLVDMSPEELVSCIDFRYISDALTPSDALAILERMRQPARSVRPMLRAGFPHTRLRRVGSGTPMRSAGSVREAVAAGWTHVKMKVGKRVEDDIRRARIVREEIGPDRRLMMDANQVWEVGDAIAET